MANGIEALQASANRHSKRACNFFAQSRAVLDIDEGNPLSSEQVAAALVLNAKAIEEFKMAINTLQFLNRFLSDKEH